MGEDARQRAAFRALEQLLEPEPRVLQDVLRTCRPLSGEQLEQVVEERALTGFCGNPMCMQQLARAAGGRMRRKLYQSTYCSTACERVVAELVRGLGTAEAARRRFANDHPPAHSALRAGFFGPPPQPQTPPREEEPQQPPGSRGRPSSRASPRRKPQQEEAGARGVGGVTVMSATVQERQPQPVSPPAPMQTATIEEITAQDMFAAADVSAAQPDVKPRGSRRPRVTFADDVQGGIEERVSAAAGGSAPTMQQPVLVLDVDSAPDAEPGTLGFGRLQVKEAAEVPGTVQAPQDSSPEQPMSSPGDLAMKQSRVDSKAAQHAAPSDGARPIIGEVVDRPVSGVTERAAGGLGNGAAEEGALPGNPRRPSRFAAKRRASGSAAGGGDDSVPDGQSALDIAGGVDSAAADAAAEQAVAAAAQRLQANMADINARLEADIADVSSASGDEDDDDEAAKGSDAESEDSEQSTFDSINMASALDMEASDDEADVPGSMPRPFSRLSNFGQLYTALDSWVTRAALDFIQGEALERQPMDMEATQRCAVFTRHVAGALPAVGRAVPGLGQLPRGVLEAPLRDLATTLDFSQPVASMQASVWEVAALTCLKALSLQQSPTLQPALESREGVTALSAALAARGLSEEHFCSLLDVLVPEDI